jgi:vacuolar-type H+-ATPase subunit I/STV1
MADKVRLTKILENAKIKLEKAYKSLERLERSLEKHISENVYTGCVTDDIRRINREIDDIKKSIEGYKEKLSSIQPVEEIPVLRRFIEKWKRSAIVFYTQEHEKLVAYKKLIQDKQKIYIEWYKELTGYSYSGCYNASIKETENKRVELGIDAESIRKYQKDNFTALTLDIGISEGWKAQLEKYIQAEAERKYRNFLVRIKSCVGDTLDCSGLYISPNAEISGIAVGELGKVRVETITAGGYNIQCLHYRILVNMVN